MRMSCNGCRVLRKGCSDDCTIRPCLQWIKTPESQAHATLFLAKFYGRAGLLNLINAGPNHLRPAIFRSLLYEACGRILNPIYGSVGLLWSGNWPLCQNAVDAVLKGSPIKPISPNDDDDGSTSPLLPSALKDGYNIRHVIKDPHHLHHSTSSSTREVDSNTAHRVRNRTRFKKSSSKPVIKCSHDQTVVVVNPAPTETVVDDVPVRDGGNVVSNWVSGSLSPSRDSSMSHGNGETNESMVSVEMTEAVAPVGRERISSNSGGGCEPEVDLRLGLGFGFGFECSRGGSGTEQRKSNLNDCVLDKRRTGFVTELGLS